MKTKLLAVTWALSGGAGVVIHGVQAEDWRLKLNDLGVLFADGRLCVRSRNEPGLAEYIFPREHVAGAIGVLPMSRGA